MWDVVKILAPVIVIMLLFELLDLPDWIGQKLSGGDTKNKGKMKRKIKELEKRIEALEKEIKNRGV